MRDAHYVLEFGRVRFRSSEYFLKHRLVAQNGVLNMDLAARGEPKPEEVVWRARPAEGEGKLDLLVTIDFRMNTTTLFSDIVLPTATWYEKNDLNTTDMHTLDRKSTRLNSSH